MIIDGVQIDFGIIDQTIARDNFTGATGGDSPYSAIENTMNVTDQQYKIAYLEQDYFLLDGSFTLPDKDKYDVGYESDDLSNENGEFSTDEYVEYKFDNIHVSYGIQLYFREDCIAKDFSISFYKDDEFIDSIEAKNNTDTRWTDYTAVLDWNRIRITFIKVNPGQRARLSEITFGINAHYTEDNLISVSASQRTDISGDYNDCGEFSFTFFNEKLDMLNVKGLAMGLMEWLRTKIYVKYHGEDDYKLFGEYFSETADVSEKGKTVSITGYDRLYLLNESYYNRGVVHEEGWTLGEWAEDVADDAGIAVIIDAEFYEIISYGYITEVPHREALRLIAEAGNGVLIVEPTGEIHLSKLKITDKGELSDDDITNDGLDIENPEKYLGVNVNAYTFLMTKKYYEDEDEFKTDMKELAYIEEVGLTDEPQTIDIVYGTYPVWIGDLTVKVEGVEEVVQTPQIFVNTAYTNAEIVEGSVNRYADHITFQIRMKPKTDPTYDPHKTQNYTWIIITGRPYNTAATNVTQGSLVKDVKEIKDNFLITPNIAQSVADYQYESVARKYNYRAEIVVDEEIKIGDRVEIQDNKVIVEGVKFNISYGEHNVTIEGIDEDEQTHK